MNNYELMVIFTPVLSDEDFKSEQKKYASFVKEHGGVVLHENPWGLKSLAYPIQKKTTGLYWVMEYTAQSDFNEKMKIQMLRDENVLRHLCTKLDKYAVEYNAKKRSGVSTPSRALVSRVATPGMARRWRNGSAAASGQPAVTIRSSI